jgi:hypothetical protein
MPSTSSASPLFATVNRIDYLGFSGESGFRPRSLVDFLKLSNADVAHISGLSKNSVRYDSDIPKAMLERLEQIASICNLVAQFFDGSAEKTTLWFTTKNPMLGDMTPRDMIRFGRYDKLRRFVIGAIVDDQSDQKSMRQAQRRTERAATRSPRLP